MILLGSVDRLELEALLDDYLRQEIVEYSDETQKVPPPRSRPTKVHVECPVHGEKVRTSVDVTIPEEEEEEDERERERREPAVDRVVPPLTVSLYRLHL